MEKLLGSVDPLALAKAVINKPASIPRIVPYLKNYFGTTTAPAVAASGRGDYTRQYTRKYVGSSKKMPPRKYPKKKASRPAYANKRTGGYVCLEKKFIDYEVAGQAFATTWTTMDPAGGINNLCGASQGVGQSDYEGRTMYIHSIHIRGQVLTANTESNVNPLDDQICRVLLVWDKQTNAAQIAGTTVMDDTLSQKYNSFRNLEHTQRCSVLIDKMIRISRNNQVNEGSVNLYASGAVIMNFTMNWNFKEPIKVIKTGTTALVGSIADNSFHIVGVANQVNTTLRYQVRTRFTSSQC